jgi:hypothetical protein
MANEVANGCLDRRFILPPQIKMNDCSQPVRVNYLGRYLGVNSLGLISFMEKFFSSSPGKDLVAQQTDQCPLNEACKATN